MTFKIVAAIIVPVVFLSTAVGDETTEKKGISSDAIEGYVQQLAKEQHIISDLKVRLLKGEIVFDVTSTTNADQRSWLVQVNVSETEFKAASEKYAADGFEMPVHEIITVKRKKLHSAVWVQKTEGGETLTLPAGDPPESGETGRGLQPLNELMRQILRDNNIPGATLAVAHRGKLIFNRGFGYSDIEQSVAMSPDANMRIASVSKPITAVAVLILMEQGKLELDKPVIEYLSMDPSHRFATKKAVEIDPRWKQISVRQLLQHSGGWDKDISKDPMFQLVDISRTLKLDHPALTSDVVAFQLGRPLGFDPGSKYVYSNFGYCLLGRIIEVVAGQSYESFVAENIFKPAGMTGTRLAKTRLTDRADDEVRYYTQKLQKFPAVWDLAASKTGQFEMVAAPYGQWEIEIMDSHGGWTSTAADLVRFVSAVDSSSSPLLQPESRRMMLLPPSFADPAGRNSWYGLGWSVRPAGPEGETNWWHSGSLPGTASLLVRRGDGYSWAVLMNVNLTKSEKLCADVIDGPLHDAIDRSVR
jgi:N-acyl-D-amino-acid deacylase